MHQLNNGAFIYNTKCSICLFRSFVSFPHKLRSLKKKKKIRRFSKNFARFSKNQIIQDFSNRFFLCVRFISVMSCFSVGIQKFYFFSIRVSVIFSDLKNYFLSFHRFQFNVPEQLFKRSSLSEECLVRK